MANRVHGFALADRNRHGEGGMEHIVCDGVATEESTRSYAYWSVAQPRSLVVMVHGWGGDRVATWEPINWFLSKSSGKRAPHDVLFYGYESRDQPVAVSSTQFARFIQRFLADPTAIVNESSAIPVRDRPTHYETVTFVCHSLGAVVVRQALLDLATRVRPAPEWLKLSQLVLFAPAHKGATITAAVDSFLSIFSSRVAQATTLVRGIRWPSLKDLEPESTFLQTLETESKAHLATVADATYARADTVIWASRDAIVKRENFASDNLPVIIPDTDHQSVCKPAKPQDPAFQLLMSRL